MIGVLIIPNAFAESIIKEKECVEIGKELDSNIKCRIVLTENIGSPFYHDQERDILYFGNSHNYIGRDWDSLNILIQRVSCDPVTTGTYVETTTYPCELQHTSNQNGKKALQTETTIPYIYEIKPAGYYKNGKYLYDKCPLNCSGIHQWDSLQAKTVDVLQTGSGTSYKTGQVIHTYKTDLEGIGNVYLNTDKNELYYFVFDKNSLGYNAPQPISIIYLINGHCL